MCEDCKPIRMYKPPGARRAHDEALIAATAMSLYIYNVSPGLRAERLYRHFAGACAEPDELRAGLAGGASCGFG